MLYYSVYDLKLAVTSRQCDPAVVVRVGTSFLMRIRSAGL